MLNNLSDIIALNENKFLGEGAFSKVIKVQHIKNNQIYALKQMNLKEINHNDQRNLKQEVLLHMKLDHPNIIKFVDCLQIEHQVYFLLEYAGNGSLFFYIDIDLGLPQDLTFRFFHQILLAVNYIHQKNIIHRDIKPENMLLDQDFNIKLCDFGWACQVNEFQERDSICGTF